MIPGLIHLTGEVAIQKMWLSKLVKKLDLFLLAVQISQLENECVWLTLVLAEKQKRA